LISYSSGYFTGDKMPINFTGDKNALSSWLKREYSDAEASRRQYTRLLNEWDRQYESTPRVAVKTFPWPNASNLEVPVGASHVDTVVSRLESAYFSTFPWVTVRSNDDRFRKNAAALEDFMNQVSLPQSGYREEKSQDLLAMAKLGTSFQWLGYVQHYKTIRQSDGRKLIIPIHEGPLQTFIHPKHLIVPSDAKDLQTCRWATIRQYKTWGELIHNRNIRMYDSEAVNSLDGRGIQITEDSMRNARQGIRDTNGPLQWQINTTFAYYQPYRYAEQEDIWIDWHWPSGIILSSFYAPFTHYQRPISKSVYMQREGSFIGLGIMGMISAVQEEITTIHNYCLDNMLASNTVMLIVKQIIKDLEIMPMGQIVMPGDDKSVRIERLGQALSGQQVGEAAASSYADRRTGAGENNFPQMSSFRGAQGVRTPATTTLALIGEGNKRFQLAIENAKRSDSILLRQHMLLLRQYWSIQRPIAEQWHTEKTRLISDLFGQAPQNLSNLLVIEVAASSSTINNEVEKNNMMILAQFMQQFNAIFIQYVNLISKAPALEPVIRKMLNGASEFVERLLRVFGIRDPERFIPRVDDIGATAATEPEPTNNEITQRFLDGARFERSEETAA
jgi:hypothetical protein